MSEESELPVILLAGVGKLFSTACPVISMGEVLSIELEARYEGL